MSEIIGLSGIPALEAEMRDRLKAKDAEKDAAYLERNRLVALLASLYPSGIARTDIPGWLPEWHNCVYIDLPTGQASWHYHDSHAHLFAHLPPYRKQWDGHTTEQKYERVAALGAAKRSEKLWLWRNGPGRFLAFDNLFPTVPDGGDPATLGQPAGYAFFHPMTLAEAQAVSRAASKQDAANAINEAAD